MIISICPIVPVDHAKWASGVRRTVVELREVYGQVVNHKVVRRLHQLWELALLRTTQPPRPNPLREIIVQAGNRANLVAQLAEIPPLTVLCTDFTEIRYANGQRKAYFMPLLDHAGKFVYGWSLSPSANRTAALAAWHAARETLEHLQVSCQGLIVHHDQDTVYTSHAWTGQLLHVDNVRLSYSLNGARGNTEMEAFFSRFKSEGASPFLVADDFAELACV